MSDSPHICGSTPSVYARAARLMWDFAVRVRENFRPGLGTTTGVRTLHSRDASAEVHSTGTTDSVRDGEDMATDYDNPRKTEEETTGEDSLQELQSRRQDKSTSTVDMDENEQAENFELPGADLSNEELSVRVLPRQADEFTCERCFLVHHRSQLAKEKNGKLICRECA